MKNERVPKTPQIWKTSFNSFLSGWTAAASMANHQPPKNYFWEKFIIERWKNNKFQHLKNVFTSNPDKIEATIFLLFPTSNHSGTPKRTLSRHPAIMKFSFEIITISRPFFSKSIYFFANITLFTKKSKDNLFVIHKRDRIQVKLTTFPPKVLWFIKFK